MAYENLQLSYPNFCVAPVAGTFANLHGTNTLRVKNSTGAIQNDYLLSDNITNELLCIEYVGPRNLTAAIDGLLFFTIEKANSTSVVIKKWEIDQSGLQLDLIQTITKGTSGVNYYNGVAGCVEYYERQFDSAEANGSDHITVSSSSRISSGVVLFLGPSNDIDNLGEGEFVTVDYVTGRDVYFTTNITKDYLVDDQVAFYTYIYIYSSLGHNGNPADGTLFQLDATNGSLISTNYDGFYKSVNTCKWFPATGNIPSVVGTNMVFVSPYDSYLNWRSMSLNNLDVDKATTLSVYDLAFDNNTIYKLMQKMVKKADDGQEAATDWSPYYNFLQDSLLPYTNSLHMYTDKSIMIGQQDVTDLTVIVRDQFGVGLNGVAVTVARDGGDSGAVLDPLDGQVFTNSSGIAEVIYTSGAVYHGATNMTCKAAGGLPLSGSIWVWDSMYIHSKIEHANKGRVIQPLANNAFIADFLTLIKQLDLEVSPQTSLFCKTYFTSPGGDWVNPSNASGDVSQYLPHLIVGYRDGPQEGLFGWEDAQHPGENHIISQVADAEGDGRVKQLGDFTSYNDRLRQVEDAEHDLQISQLKMSQHTNWVGGVAYDELFTNTSINQFVFVEDAIPKFWSYKNPIDTTIWIRLRPFAFDLDASTLKFYVKEVSYAGDTGYVEMGSYLTITPFDAGGGIDGLDILCTPPADFHYNAMVYVRIELYDTAAIPNFIWVDYWFGVTPDYRFPYLDNLAPSREQDDVPVDTEIYFEIKDLGVGVDIDSMEITVNSRIVTPTTITRINDNHYEVTCVPSNSLQFSKTILVNVKSDDLSSNNNLMNDSYRFYTVKSEGLWYTDFEPGECKRGMPRYSSIRLVVLDAGGGVDGDTIKVQVLEREATDKFTIVPIVYRIS